MATDQLNIEVQPTTSLGKSSTPINKEKPLIPKKSDEVK